MYSYNYHCRLNTETVSSVHQHHHELCRRKVFACPYRLYLYSYYMIYSWYVDTNVLEEQMASIPTYSLELQEVCFFKQPASTYLNTCCHIWPQNTHFHRHADWKLYFTFILFCLFCHQRSHFFAPVVCIPVHTSLFDFFSSLFSCVITFPFDNLHSHL